MALRGTRVRMSRPHEGVVTFLQEFLDLWNDGLGLLLGLEPVLDGASAQGNFNTVFFPGGVVFHVNPNRRFTCEQTRNNLYCKSRCTRTYDH